MPGPNGRSSAPVNVQFTSVSPGIRGSGVKSRETWDVPVMPPTKKPLVLEGLPQEPQMRSSAMIPGSLYLFIMGFQ
jgi:hypothetical protein